MIVSYKWLQRYFKDTLPAAEKVADAFTFGAFEVEGLEKVGDDTAIDLKVLPDRACYALSHRGVAYELGAILDLPVEFPKAFKMPVDAAEKVSVEVAEKKLCSRYCARYIKNISVDASPDWLRNSLEVVGQRSINGIVDATNLKMLDIGQPLHAFDADKVQGGIVVRLAKQGEKIELLPEKGGTTSRVAELVSSDLVIADDVGPIAIAGVKGGLRAAVTSATKNLILESANFDSAAVRRTATRLALRNDASKRFENAAPVAYIEQAMQEVSQIIKKLCPAATFGEVTDIFSEQPTSKNITVSKDFISARLGVQIDETNMEAIFKRLALSFEKQSGEYILKVPPFRGDLNIPEDIVEEVGRIYGYDKIAPAIPKKTDAPVPVNQTAYWTEKIKDILFGLGYSEVQTSSFALDGEVEIQNPLASDKKFLRNVLYDNLQKSLDENRKNAPLFSAEEIKIFEIGTVFNSNLERLVLGIGVSIAKNLKKKDQAILDQIKNTIDSLSTHIGKEIRVPLPPLGNEMGRVAEIDLSEIITNLPQSNDWGIKKFEGNTKYTPFSVYPYMVRDVAVFVPSSVSESEVSSVIDAQSGPLKVRRDLFDVFTKKFENGEEKTSYAFRLVFQSPERTLKEEEINEVMKNISDALSAKSWQVR